MKDNSNLIRENLRQKNKRLRRFTQDHDQEEISEAMALGMRRVELRQEKVIQSFMSKVQSLFMDDSSKNNAGKGGAKYGIGNDEDINDRDHGQKYLTRQPGIVDNNMVTIDKFMSNKTLIDDHFKLLGRVDNLVQV